MIIKANSVQKFVKDFNFMESTEYQTYDIISEDFDRR